MKKTFTFKSLFLACTFLFIGNFAHAQLSAGDIAFVGFNADAAPNEISIVTLAPVASGQTIIITDYAWNGTSLDQSNSIAEGVITWTTNTTVPAGTIIKFNIDPNAVVTGGLSAFGTVNASGWSGDAIASGGDNWFILQGSITTPAFIYAYANWATASAGIKTWPTSGVTFPNATVSYLPSSLTNGTTANIQSGDPAYHFDNHVYTGPKTGTKAAILAALTNSANWTGNEATTVDIAPGGPNFPGANPIFTVGTPASITGQPINKTVCANGNTAFSITASNATGYQWQVNTGSGFTNIQNGAIYTGANTTTLTITGAVSSMNSYTYQAIAIGTPSATSNIVTLTVNALPVAIATPNPVKICSGTDTKILLSSTPAGASFAWTVTPVSGTVTGASAGAGTLIAQTLSGNGTTNYTVTPTLNACIGSPITVAVTVNPSPTAAATPTAQTICSGTDTKIVLSSTPAGASFAWTAATASGTVTGASAGAGTLIAQTLSGNGTINYTVTPTLNACIGSPITVAVTVNPSPAAAATPTAQTICSGIDTKIVLSSTPAGASFAWTAATASGTVTGASAGSGTLIAQTLSGNGTTNYTVTPTLNACIGSPITVAVTVNPSPTAAATPASQTICSGTDTKILFSSTPANASFAWTAATASGTVTGASAGSGTLIAQTLSGNGTINYSVTPTLNNCTGSPITVTVTVKPTPIVNAVTPNAICSGTATNIALVSTPAGAAFNYNAPTETGVSGGSSGTQNPIAQTLSTTGFTSGATAVYSVTATLAGCTGAVTKITQPVNSLPSGSTTITGATISAIQNNATYKWFECSKAGTILATSKSYTPTVSGNYAVIVTLNNCDSTSICKFVDVTITGNNDHALSGNTISVYPNPASDILHITAKKNICGTVSITDLQGNVVYENSISDKDFSVATDKLANGVYLLNVSSDSIITTQKLVIVR